MDDLWKVRSGSNSLTRHRVWWTASFAVLLAFWAALLSLPDYVYGVTLDDSWEQGMAALYQRDAQAGTDYIFALGPLGYFCSNAYVPNLFWAKLAWEAVLKLAMAVTFTAILWRLPSIAGRISFALLIITILGPANRSVRDASYNFFLLAAALLTLDKRTLSPAGCAYLIGLTVLAQVKGSLLVLTTIYVLIRTMFFAWSRRFSEALLTLAIFACAWLGVWLALGQSVLNIPAYAYGTLQIAGGFAALAIDSPERWYEIWLAIGALATFAALWFMRDRQATSGRLAAALALVLCVSVFFQWKHGFTRHDGGHAIGFFAYALFVPFALIACMPPPPARLWGVRFVAACSVVICLIGVHSAAYPPENLPELAYRNLCFLKTNARQIFRPWAIRDQLEEQAGTVPTDWQLPRIKNEVGDARVDLLTNMQGYLFANRLTWAPRPGFQSQTAYTPFLLEANAAFLRSNQAPEYLLLASTTLDDRLPPLDDALAWREILYHYRPVLIEKGYLLVKRAVSTTGSQQSTDVQKMELDKDVRIGEPVSLPDTPEYQVLSLDVRQTLWGRLRSFFFKPGPLTIQVTLTDGHERSYRLIPGMISAGVIINPFLADDRRLTDGILRLYGLPGGSRVTSFRVNVPDGAISGYDPTIHMKVNRIAPPPWPSLSSEDVQKLLAH
jgi:hypothetical protein